MKRKKEAIVFRELPAMKLKKLSTSQSPPLIFVIHHAHVEEELTVMFASKQQVHFCSSSLV